MLRSCKRVFRSNSVPVLKFTIFLLIANITERLKHLKIQTTDKMLRLFFVNF
jgi:hypothetical protein